MGNESAPSSAKFWGCGFDRPIGDDSIVERILDVNVTAQLIQFVDQGDEIYLQDPYSHQVLVGVRDDAQQIRFRSHVRYSCATRKIEDEENKNVVGAL